MITLDQRAPLPPGAPIGIYVHIPFCAHICPYCDFNTYAGQSDLIPRYVVALERELGTVAPEVTGRHVASIYFGGGTPSLLSPAQIETVLAAITSLYSVAPDVEVTIEANPNGLTVAYLDAIRALGINRLSLGAQTLDRRGLRTLGRLHEAADVLTAVAAAREAGFANVSVDLIFGWPGQTLASWEHDLSALATGPAGPVVDHLSLYSLIVEPGTPYADAVARGVLRVADDDLSADMFELALDQLGAAGFLHYEVANFAWRPELQSLHNRLYWLNGDYLGIGAGAHGYRGGIRAMNHLLPARYIAAVMENQAAASNAERITTVGAMGETMMLGLRLPASGVSRDAFRLRHGQDLDAVFGPSIARFVAVGLVADDGETVRLTRSGLMLANDVCAEFVVDPALATVAPAEGGNA